MHSSYSSRSPSRSPSRSRSRSRSPSHSRSRRSELNKRSPRGSNRRSDSPTYEEYRGPKPSRREQQLIEQQQREQRDYEQQILERNKRQKRLAQEGRWTRGHRVEGPEMLEMRRLERDTIDVDQVQIWAHSPEHSPQNKLKKKHHFDKHKDKDADIQDKLKEESEKFHKNTDSDSQTSSRQSVSESSHRNFPTQEHDETQDSQKNIIKSKSKKVKDEKGRDDNSSDSSESDSSQSDNNDSSDSSDSENEIESSANSSESKPEVDKKKKKQTSILTPGQIFEKAELAAVVFRMSALTNEPNEDTVVTDTDVWPDAKKHTSEDGEEDIVGPKPPPTAAPALDPRSYGGALMPGEGEAIAGFVQAGKRIPRRGEIGLTSDQIEEFEKLGYVMSGSRHKRMNAIRIRKENQVYSAEEKRALSLLNFEEKANKEKKLMADFRKYLQEKEAQT